MSATKVLKSRSVPEQETQEASDELVTRFNEPMPPHPQFLRYPECVMNDPSLADPRLWYTFVPPPASPTGPVPEAYFAQHPVWMGPPSVDETGRPPFLPHYSPDVAAYLQLLYGMGRFPVPAPSPSPNMFAPAMPAMKRDGDSEQSPPAKDLDRKTRRKRVRISAEQLQSMEEVFQSNQYPKHSSCVALAEQLCLPTHTVKIWFQNRRARYKREQRPSKARPSSPTSFHSASYSGSGQSSRGASPPPRRSLSNSADSLRLSGSAESLLRGSASMDSLGQDAAVLLALANSTR